jgi:hypothetical protein
MIGWADIATDIYVLAWLALYTGRDPMIAVGNDGRIAFGLV